MRLKPECWLYFTLKRPFVGCNGCGLPSRHTCSRPSSDCPAGTPVGRSPPELFSTRKTLLDQDLPEENSLSNCDWWWTTKSRPTFFHCARVQSGPHVLVLHRTRGPRFLLTQTVDIVLRGRVDRYNPPLGDDLGNDCSHSWVRRWRPGQRVNAAFPILLSYLSEQLQPKGARTREDAWLWQPGLPEPFTSSALHLKKWQQLRPFGSIKIKLAVMCSSALAAYWPNYTKTANNSWLRRERLCCIRGEKKGRCYRCCLTVLSIFML